MDKRINSIVMPAGIVKFCQPNDVTVFYGIAEYELGRKQAAKLIDLTNSLLISKKGICAAIKRLRKLEYVSESEYLINWDHVSENCKLIDSLSNEGVEILRQMCNIYDGDPEKYRSIRDLSDSEKNELQKYRVTNPVIFRANQSDDDDSYTILRAEMREYYNSLSQQMSQITTAAIEKGCVQTPTLPVEAEDVEPVQEKTVSQKLFTPEPKGYDEFEPGENSWNDLMGTADNKRKQNSDTEDDDLWAPLKRYTGTSQKKRDNVRNEYFMWKGEKVFLNIYEDYGLQKMPEFTLDEAVMIADRFEKDRQGDDSIAAEVIMGQCWIYLANAVDAQTVLDRQYSEIEPEEGEELYNDNDIPERYAWVRWQTWKRAIYSALDIWFGDEKAFNLLDTKILKDALNFEFATSDEDGIEYIKVDKTQVRDPRYLANGEENPQWSKWLNDSKIKLAEAKKAEDEETRERLLNECVSYRCQQVNNLCNKALGTDFTLVGDISYGRGSFNTASCANLIRNAYKGRQVKLTDGERAAAIVFDIATHFSPDSDDAPYLNSVCCKGRYAALKRAVVAFMQKYDITNIDEEQLDILLTGMKDPGPIKDDYWTKIDFAPASTQGLLNLIAYNRTIRGHRQKPTEMEKMMLDEIEKNGWGEDEAIMPVLNELRKI